MKLLAKELADIQEIGLDEQTLIKIFETRTAKLNFNKSVRLHHDEVKHRFKLK